MITPSIFHGLKGYNFLYGVIRLKLKRISNHFQALDVERHKLIHATKIFKH